MMTDNISDRSNNGLGFILNEYEKEHIEDTTNFAVSISNHISETNRGYRMLQKFGWVKGRGLGKSSSGRLEPISVGLKQYSNSLGLGGDERIAMDFGLDDEKKERKLMKAEIIAVESEAEKLIREEANLKNEILQSEVKNRLFICEICVKEYKLVKELENHLSSYDHHHQKRLRDMQLQARDAKREQKLKQVEKQKKKDMQQMLDRASTSVSIMRSHKTNITTSSTIDRKVISNPIKMKMVLKKKESAKSAGFSSFKKVTSNTATKKQSSLSLFGKLNELEDPSANLPKRVIKISKPKESLPLFVKESGK